MFSLPKYLIGEFKRRFSFWDQQVNENWRKIDMLLGVVFIKERLATFADLPPSPADGDTYLVEGTLTLYTWIDAIEIWQPVILKPYVIFWDDDADGYYYHNGTDFFESGANLFVKYDDTFETHFQWDGGGDTTATKSNIIISRVGKNVTLRINSFLADTGTGSAEMVSVDTLPNWAFPVSNDVHIIVQKTENASSAEVGRLRVDVNGFIRFSKNGGGPFIDGAQAGVPDNFVITYPAD